MEKLEPLKQIKNIETGKEVKLNLCEVIGSIGSDTKKTIITLTPEQKKGDWTACEHCKYNNDKKGQAENCYKCYTDLDLDQYYL